MPRRRTKDAKPLASRSPVEPARALRIRIGDRQYVLLSIQDGPAQEEPPASSPVPRLTPAERDVASALLRGLSNDAIAVHRGSAPRTVANQIASLYRKLGVRSRAELAARWGAALSSATPRA